jgi:hypothetical protein
MRRSRMIVIAALFCGQCFPTSAQTPDTRSLVSLKGTCVARFLGKPLACGPRAMYAVRTNGQEFVAFATAEGVAFFFGDDIRQPAPTEHVIVINKSRFDLPNKERMENNRLRGECRLTMNLAGGPITAIDCDATNPDTGQREHFVLSDIVVLQPPH